MITPLHNEVIQYAPSMMSQGKNPGKDPWKRPLMGVFPASVGSFHLERSLKNCKLTFEGVFSGKLTPQNTAIHNENYATEIIEDLRGFSVTRFDFTGADPL